MTLARYSRWMAGSGLVFWALFLGFGAVGGYDLLQRDGRVALSSAVWLAAWSGFFVGFVVCLTSSLRARRGLLLGILQPSDREWRQLEASATARPDGIWGAVLLAATGLAGLSLGLALLAYLVGGQADLDRNAFMLGAALVPALGSVPIAIASVRRSVLRFVSALEHDRPRVMEPRVYLLLHNVLPYSLFATTVGVAVAISRFLPAALEGRAVGAEELARHLGVTALIITLLVVTAARLKTRIDFLSPLVFEPSAPGKPGAGTRWRVWYALAAPVIVYAILRLGLWATGQETLGLGAAILIKVVVCLVLAVGTAWWAVRSVLAEMQADGLDGHRYVRVHRFLKRAGFLSR